MVSRKFDWNGQDLVDPGPEYSAQEVVEMYSSMYPELVNAVVSYPDIEGGSYTVQAKDGKSSTSSAGSTGRVSIKTSVGTKG